MLTKPSPRVIQALANLEGNADFEAIKDWLRTSSISLAIDSCGCKDEVLARWSQGAVQVLNQFSDSAASAREVIRKSR